jgi:hypothetical protein
MAKNSKKTIDKRIERAYYAKCGGIQINVMDIGEVFAVGDRFLAANAGITDAWCRATAPRGQAAGRRG